MKSDMRLSSIFIMMLLFAKLHSQCLVNAINSTFVNNNAVLGHDSVMVTMTHFADITFSSGGSSFQLSINGVIQSGGNGIANVGDIVKIKPIAVGVETISVDGDCMGNFWSENNTVVRCLWDVILEEFPNNTAVIGQDSVVYTAFAQTAVSFLNGDLYFHVFINGYLQTGGLAAGDPGDVIKIMPHSVGTEEIYINIIGTTCENFENFTVSSPLPIYYSKRLEAVQKQNTTNLTWSVAIQINNDKYIIEHSKDGRSFSPIVEIAGDGTNNREHHFEFTHNNPSLGVNYYRIKQVDYDGTSSYSNIASVEYAGDGNKILIYPNPSTDEVTLSISEHMEVEVTDILGKVLHKQTVNKENNVVDLSNLPNGILIFKLGNQIQKIIKQ